MRDIGDCLGFEWSREVSNLIPGAFVGCFSLIALMPAILNIFVPIVTWHDFAMGAAFGVVMFVLMVAFLVGMVALSMWFAP